MTISLSKLTEWALGPDGYKVLNDVEGTIEKAIREQLSSGSATINDLFEEGIQVELPLGLIDWDSYDRKSENIPLQENIISCLNNRLAKTQRVGEPSVHCTIGGIGIKENPFDPGKFFQTNGADFPFAERLIALVQLRV